jgi:hypothetical protein
VRNGQVDFILGLPGPAFGHVPNNPSISESYQYPNVGVADSSLVITGEGPDPEYRGYVLMGSADAAVVKFDLWCGSPSGAFSLARTYTWTVAQNLTPTPPPSPTGTTSDIRYVSFKLMVDADISRDPVGVVIDSQVQLRNLKSNL